MLPAVPRTRPVLSATTSSLVAAADRAARLLVACEAALTDDGASLSSYEAEVRARELRAVRDAARESLCAAVTWRRTPGDAAVPTGSVIRISE